jgi:hypothetical protein
LIVLFSITPLLLCTVHFLSPSTVSRSIGNTSISTYRGWSDPQGPASIAVEGVAILDTKAGRLIMFRSEIFNGSDDISWRKNSGV